MNHNQDTEFSQLKHQVQRLEIENEKLKALLAKDQLTGLLNYSEFCRQLDKHIQVHSQMAVIMLDIDNFKQINSSLGHLAGNRVLELLAKVLKNELPMAGFLARFGGDEFLIAFPCQSSHALKAYCLLLLQRIRQSRFILNFDTSIQASIGASLSSEGDDYKSVISRADKALIQVKLDGKDNYHLIEKNDSPSKYLRKS